MRVEKFYFRTMLSGNYFITLGRKWVMSNAIQSIPQWSWKRKVLQVWDTLIL